MKTWWTAWLLAALHWMPAGQARAHESLPASLILQEQSPQVFAVRWRIPQTQGVAPKITPALPIDCIALAPPEARTAPAALLQFWEVRCATGLGQGASIGFDGLPLTLMDVVVRVTYGDGRSESHIARARQPVVVLGQAPAQALSVASYFGLGMKHILMGADHLLFVLCLILLVPDLRALLKTVTAFTLAHSITLALSALQVVQVPQAPVEATIALSILFLARELVCRRRGRNVTLQSPWIVAFVFGLLHGFGFAGALAEVGLPAGDIPGALLLFNLGVEAGQVAFVAAVLPTLWLLRRLHTPGRGWPAWTASIPAYAVGAVSACWWLQRMWPVLGLQAL